MSFLFLILGPKNFMIISVNAKIINKILFGLKILKISNDKVTVAETNFSCAGFEILSDKEKLKLSETVQDLCTFLNQFAMLPEVKNTLRLYLLKNSVQNTESDYWGEFQLYFYKQW